MANNKKELFNKLEIRIADYAKALSHPARIAILKALAENNSCICGEIVEGLPLAQSTVSQHLNELKKAGLIIGVIDGPKSCYCINWKSFEELSGIFGDLMNNLRKSKSACCLKEDK